MKPKKLKYPDLPAIKTHPPADSFILTFRNLHPGFRFNIPLCRPVVLLLLSRMGVKKAELSWYFVNAKRMACVNEKYLGHEGSTDVITFQYLQHPQKDILFGDVFICIDEAHYYAKEFQTTPQSETLRYLIHSILHLQDFDDIDPTDRKIMKSHENKWVKWIESQLNMDQILLKR
ncbi:MAG: rRNA maturation RNase YbeY [Verrucomicrobia bacterium]|nr:rRNA maturation RNase YbeY [Verrucomicrobiota bacterium]